MNRCARCPDSKGKAITNGTDRKLPALAANETAAGGDLAFPGLTFRDVRERHPIRLINASCKAFFLRRGLDPDGEWRNRIPEATAGVDEE